MSKTGSLNICFFFILVISMSSCVRYPTLINYNGSPPIPKDPQAINNLQEVTIQPNDILAISVSSIDPQSVAAFRTSGGGEGAAGGQFLVNKSGMIDFPSLGSIAVEGLTVEAIKAKILTQLESYFTQPPILQVRLMNFKVSVNGEVNSPGSFNVPSGRMTIIEAVTQAGDFTSYSQRDSIMIIRERNGQRSFGYLDFNSYDLFESPYFYLQQNDVVYVRPAKTKVNSVRDPASRFLPWVSAFVSLAALYFSVTR